MRFAHKSRAQIDRPNPALSLSLSYSRNRARAVTAKQEVQLQQSGCCDYPLPPSQSPWLNFNDLWRTATAAAHEEGEIESASANCSGHGGKKLRGCLSRKKTRASSRSRAARLVRRVRPAWILTRYVCDRSIDLAGLYIPLKGSLERGVGMCEREREAVCPRGERANDRLNELI